jgi:hypothetical protein
MYTPKSVLIDLLKDINTTLVECLPKLSERPKKRINLNRINNPKLLVGGGVEHDGDLVHEALKLLNDKNRNREIEIELEKYSLLYLTQK